MKLCKIVKRYEVLSSIVIMFISLCMSAVSLGSFLENYFSYPNVIFLEGIIIQGVLGLIMLVYAIKMGYGKGLGIKFEGGIKDSYVIWPFLVFTIINVVGSFKEIENIRVNIVNVLLYGVTFFTTGFLEELMLGIICMAFINKYKNREKGILKAVIFSSLVFATAHINAYILGRSDMLTTIVQIVNAFCMSVLYEAVFLRTKTIWMPIISSFIMEISGNVLVLSITSKNDLEAMIASMSVTAEAVIQAIILSIVFFIIGMVFLKKAK